MIETSMWHMIGEYIDKWYETFRRRSLAVILSEFNKDYDLKMHYAYDSYSNIWHHPVR